MAEFNLDRFLILTLLPPDYERGKCVPTLYVPMVKGVVGGDAVKPLRHVYRERCWTFTPEQDMSQYLLG